MLPSLGFQEIVLLAVLALVVIGPKDLPLMARKLGRWVGKLRGMAAEFRAGFDELARQAELDELKKEVDALRNNQTLRDVNRELSRPMDAAMTPPSSPPAALPAPDAQLMPASEAPPEETAAIDDPKPAAASGA